MKIRTFSMRAWIMAIGAVCAVGLRAGACPPDTPDCGPQPNVNQNPADPAFIMQDSVPNVALKQQQSLISQGAQAMKKSSDLVAVEQERFRAYSEAVKKNPEEAFSEAVAVWKANDSVDLQRLVILVALEKVSASEERDALQFMLKALDAPEVQRQECARLARGNSLEKSIAARRITLLEENPRMQSPVIRK